MENSLKEKTLSVRCRIEDKNAIEEKANAANMRVSDYIRYSCLEKENGNKIGTLLIVVLEEILDLTIRLEQHEIKKRSFIKEIKKVVDRAWESL